MTDLKVADIPYLMSLVDSVYEEPNTLIPERRYSRPDMIKDKRAFAPFGVGMSPLNAVCRRSYPSMYKRR